MAENNKLDRIPFAGGFLEATRSRGRRLGQRSAGVREHGIGLLHAASQTDEQQVGSGEHYAHSCGRRQNARHPDDGSPDRLRTAIQFQPRQDRRPSDPGADRTVPKAGPEDYRRLLLRGTGAREQPVGNPVTAGFEKFAEFIGVCGQEFDKINRSLDSAESQVASLVVSNQIGAPPPLALPSAIPAQRITQAQKRQDVAEQLLADPTRSDPEIVAHAHVSPAMVFDHRRAMEYRGEIRVVHKRTGLDGKVRASTQRRYPEPAASPPSPALVDYSERRRQIENILIANPEFCNQTISRRVGASNSCVAEQRQKLELTGRIVCVKRVVNEMPLWKLQTVGNERMDFLYDNLDTTTTTITLNLVDNYFNVVRATTPFIPQIASVTMPLAQLDFFHDANIAAILLYHTNKAGREYTGSVTIGANVA